jgi:hypothetical protein
MQWPGRGGFQALEIGVHWKIHKTIIAIAQARTVKKRIVEAMRILGTSLKARTYMRRSEVLTRKAVKM